jgi:hypothetical protein
VFKKRTPEHTVAVYEGPRPRRRRSQSRQRFIAICECGWLGAVRGSSEEAFNDAVGHDANVIEEVRQLSAETS